jgi:Tol biopolymer transport system component/DNA-binding winged helix-turn-helix (wHTH) protein
MQMPAATPSPAVLRFGVFEVDLRACELRKQGVRVKLQDQPFQVLTLLLKQPGEVVSREELRSQIWGSNTFIDFDNGLNTSINKLREALGDSADSPRFIETLPRRGYRFIEPIDSHLQLERVPVRAFSIGGRVNRPTVGRGLVGVGAAALVLLSTIAIWRLTRKPSESRLPSIEVVPLVALHGMQGSPAFSPDGNQVAFRHIGEPNTSGIYTTLIDGQKPLRLTNDPGDFNPTWSPDNRQIAFVRYSNDQQDIYVVSSLGGTEHRLVTTPVAFPSRIDRDHGGGLTWSPDGQVLAFPEGSVDRSYSWIALLSLADFTTRPLTSPPVGKSDSEPAFSPDGSTVAFVQVNGAGEGQDLFVVPAKGGEPRQLTFENSIIDGLTWAKDGRDIVFSSPLGGLSGSGLWRISASGGVPRLLQGVGTPASEPSIPRWGDRLVYRQSVYSHNIWRLNLKDEKTAQGPPVRVTSTSRGFNWRPSLSPDGKKIALESNRLGYSEIWYCDSDGSNCAQLTSLHGLAGTARVSPDGHYVAFEFRGPEHEEIYVVEVTGGRPRLVPTFSGANNGAPNWSRDGQWIYFYSDHEGPAFQLWKVPFQGGPPIRLTRNGGVYAIESDDARLLYYSKIAEPGIWRMPIGGGEEVRVLDQAIRWVDWAITGNGVYFLERYPSNEKIEFLDFATHKTVLIRSLKEFIGGLAVSPDGRSLLYSQEDFSDSYIMLVKNFR